MASPYGRYTIRLSDPTEFTGLYLGESVNLAAENKNKNGDDAKPIKVEEPLTRRSSRQASLPTSNKSTRRRKRQASLRLSENSPVFLEMERICQDSDMLDKLSQTTNSLQKFALVGAIQPNDSLEFIHSLGRSKTFKCTSASVNVQDILSKQEHYPLNLVFVRAPNVVTPCAPRKRLRNHTKKPAVNKRPSLISLLSSEEEDNDDEAVMEEEEEEEQEEHVVVSVDNTVDNKPPPSAFVARPDPTPGYQADEWVLTPLGPGFIESYRIDRLADSLDSLVNPILTYQVHLPFGTLFVPASQVQPFEGSPYANKVVVSSPKLTRGDVVRLQPGVYLNDNLVNFYLTLSLERSNNSKVHVFSSYFYTRIADLSQGQNKNSPEFHSLLWKNIKGWIKNVDIWDMDLLLIPIHDRLHWSVVAVCHPGLLLHTNVDDVRMPCLLHLDSGKRFRLHTPLTLFTRIRTFLQVCLEEQHKMQVRLTSANLPCASPPVPAQANETDCGVYMLEWIERLVREGLVVTKEFVEAKGNVPPFGKTAFSQSLMDRKRNDFQSLIYELSTAERQE